MVASAKPMPLVWDRFETFIVHRLDWETLPDGRSRLKAVTTVRVEHPQRRITAARYEAA